MFHRRVHIYVINLLDTCLRELSICLVREVKYYQQLCLNNRLHFHNNINDYPFQGEQNMHHLLEVRLVFVALVLSHAALLCRVPPRGTIKARMKHTLAAAEQYTTVQCHKTRFLNAKSTFAILIFCFRSILHLYRYMKKVSINLILLPIVRYCISNFLILEQCVL